MKFVSVPAMSMLAGMLLFALSGPGIVVPAASAEEPSPVASQGSESTAQNEPEAADVAAKDKAANDKAANDKAANDGAEEEIDLAAMQKAGYKIVDENGVKLFCKKEEILGSRLRTRTRCLTAAQIEQEQNAASRAISDASRAAQNLPGD